MAKNKRDVERLFKQEEIEAAAARLFIEHGYEATSMSMIAKQAEVAPNTLYWYYENKDDILVATLNRLVANGVAEYALVGDKPLSEQMLWLIEQFEQVSKLISTVHARLDHSPVIRAWHDQFHLMLDHLVVTQLCSQGVSSTQAKLMATIGTFVVEGLLSHPHSKKQRETIVGWLTKAGSLMAGVR